jgi:hypothetical protein
VIEGTSGHPLSALTGNNIRQEGGDSTRRLVAGDSTEALAVQGLLIARPEELESPTF